MKYNVSIKRINAFCFIWNQECQIWIVHVRTIPSRGSENVRCQSNAEFLNFWAREMPHALKYTCYRFKYEYICVYAKFIQSMYVNLAMERLDLNDFVSYSSVMFQLVYKENFSILFPKIREIKKYFPKISSFSLIIFKPCCL